MSNFLCIGVPARNEEESILRTLKSLLKSDIWVAIPQREKEIVNAKY